MSMAPSQLGAFTRSDPGRNHANLEYHVQPLSLDAFGEPLHAFPAITASVCNLNPTSRGRVASAARARGRAARSAPNYLSTDEDRQVAARACALTRRVCAQPALARYAPGGVEARRRRSRPTRTSPATPAISPRRSSTRSAPPPWARPAIRTAVLDPHMRMRDGGAASSPACGWWTPAPCPSSRAATPTRRC